jgi:subtilisin-like proprotein convertase family protein
MTGSVCGVQVVTNITHAYAADITLALESPEGVVVPLSLNQAGDAVDVFAGTTWSDNGAENVWDATYVSGTANASLVPELSFEAFLNSAGNGDWTLHLEDFFAEDSGTLVSWGLNLTSCSCPE